MEENKNGSQFKLHRGELTKREKELVILMAQGYSIQEISEKLFISIFTVRSHRKAIYQKLGIKKLIHIGVYAERHGLLDGRRLNLK